MGHLALPHEHPGPLRHIRLLDVYSALSALQNVTPHTFRRTVANGSKRLPAYIIAPVSITKANYKQLFNGYLKRSEVCRGEYRKFCK